METSTSDSHGCCPFSMRMCPGTPADPRHQRRAPDGASLARGACDAGDPALGLRTRWNTPGKERWGADARIIRRWTEKTQYFDA